jgi:hypothetical protein
MTSSAVQTSMTSSAMQAVDDLSALSDASSTLSDVCSELSMDDSDMEGEPCKVIIGRNALPRSIALSTLSSIPRDETGNWLSTGSEKHQSNTCVPCKWFRSAKGCKDGVLCRHCHAPHENLSRHAMKSFLRRTARNKRRFFEAGETPDGMELPNIRVKNTMVHIDDSEDESSELQTRRMRRSASTGTMRDV